MWSTILNICKFGHIILVQWNNNISGLLKTKVLYTTNHFQWELKGFGILVQLLDRLMYFPVHQKKKKTSRPFRASTSMDA